MITSGAVGAFPGSTPEGGKGVPVPEWTVPDRVEDTLRAFYRVERAGAVRLSDGGGPFGFDVTRALLVDDLVVGFGCDVLVETGCFLWDTTAYLAARYPDIPVFSCDVVAEHAAFPRRRLELGGLANAQVTCTDSPALVSAVCQSYERPLFYLDAHWEDRWPLEQELAAITSGVILVDDFDIGHPRFSFDSYAGQRCDKSFFAALKDGPSRYWTPDPQFSWPLPCLQVGRRSGLGISVIGLEAGFLEHHPALVGHEL